MADYSFALAPVCSQVEDDHLRRVLQDVETEAVNFGYRFVKDAQVRRDYISSIRKMSMETMTAYRSGAITAEEGARTAQAMRNTIMDAQRAISSDLGRAIAEKGKLRGKSLPELQERYAGEVFGSKFESLADGQKARVFSTIIERSGVDRARFSVWTPRLARIGRGLELLTVAIAVYNITTAQDKLEAAAKEGVAAGGGFLGGAAGGALAGLACGPGAPVCVTIGIFAGGALGAFGFGIVFEQLRGH
jgi:hypothetical protein